MSETNTDRVVGLIVDRILDSMKQQQLGGKIPDAAFDAVRTTAVLAASTAIPPPIRLAINAVPSSAFKAAENVAATGSQNIRDGVQNIRDNIKDSVAGRVETVTGLLKGKQ
jgi:hypothetical protein